MQTVQIPCKLKAVKPWYMHRWPWLLMLGPALVIVAGVHTTWLAFSQADALVVDDYYKQGKAINQDLRRDRVAATMGLAANMQYDAALGRLTGTMASRDRPLQGKLHIKLIHSTLPQKDLKFDTQTDARGAFSVKLPMLDMARWQVVVEGEQRDWRLHGIWSWPQQRQMELHADPVMGG